MEVYVSKALEDGRLEVRTSKECRRYGALVPNDKYEWVNLKSFFDYYYRSIDKANSIVDIVSYDNVLLLKMVRTQGSEVSTEIEKVVFDSYASQDPKVMEGISRLISHFNENKTRTIKNVTENIATAQERHIKAILLETMEKFLKDGVIDDLAEEELELVRAYVNKYTKYLSENGNFNYIDSKYENYYCNTLGLSLISIIIALISTFVAIFSIPFPISPIPALSVFVGSIISCVGTHYLGNFFQKKGKLIAIESLKLELDRIYQEEQSDSKDAKMEVKKRKLKSLGRKITLADDFLLKDISSLIQLIYKNPYDGCRENLISLLEIAKDYTQNAQDSEVTNSCLQSYATLKRKIYENLGIKLEVSSKESTKLISSISEGIAIIDDEKPKTHVISPIDTSHLIKE